MLFAICSDRGSPGCSTTALALAAARGLPAAVVEADPYGGDLALRLRPDANPRHPLPPTPTVLGVGAGRPVQPVGQGPIGLSNIPQDGSRHLDLWREESHKLSRLVRVVPGFLSAELGIELAWAVLSSALQSQTVPVFADLGRIHSGSPSMPIAEASDALIPVCRGDMGSVLHLVDRLERLTQTIAARRGRPPLVLPVVVADRRYGAQNAAHIAEVLNKTSVGPTLKAVGWLAWDRTGLHALENGGDPWSKPLKTSHLMRSARRVIWRLGMATGLDHAEPEDGRPTRAEKNEQKRARRAAAHPSPTLSEALEWSTHRAQHQSRSPGPAAEPETAPHHHDRPPPERPSLDPTSPTAAEIRPDATTRGHR